MTNEPKAAAHDQEQPSPLIPIPPSPWSPVILTAGPSLSNEAMAALRRLWEMQTQERIERWQFMLDEFPEFRRLDFAELVESGRALGVQITEAEIVALLGTEASSPVQETEQGDPCQPA